MRMLVEIEVPSNKTTNENTPIRCNRCDAKFYIEKEMERDPFCGQKAARVQEFSQCPKCGQSDHHWVYANDIMPIFSGGYDKCRTQERRWMMEN